jgi:6-pyruvoyltetrahydropterin/6-carboxytetrahydropterin synthase
LTSRYRFSASHRLHAPALSDEENRKLYGKCNNPYGHGHDYVLDLTLEGALDASGQVVNRMALDALVKEMVLARLDHKDLNSDVPEFELIPPTSENLAALIRSWLERHWTLAARLVRVQIAETGKNRFVWERAARGALAK